MLRPRRLALFLPADTPFYRQLFAAMHQGFAAQGVEVVGGCRLPEPNELVDRLATWRVEVVLEMNRTRNALPDLPKKIRHIAWIVDTNGKPGSSFRGSEILYFFGVPWLNHHPHDDHQILGWLPPGSSPELYSYYERPYASLMSFVGHIPRKWTSFERCRVVAPGLLFGELYRLLIHCWSENDTKNFANDQYVQCANRIIVELLGRNIEIVDPVLRYDIGCRSVRMMNRAKLITQALGVSHDLCIYGPDNWCDWPEFEKHYKGYLATPERMTEIYQSSCFNLHEGVGPHFRSFDCMAAGGLLLYKRSPDDYEYGGLATIFEPGVHYLDFDENDLLEKISIFTKDVAARRAIAQKAAREIRAHHTWAHRAGRILSDLQEIN